ISGKIYNYRILSVLFMAPLYFNSAVCFASERNTVSSEEQAGHPCTFIAKSLLLDPVIVSEDNHIKLFYLSLPTASSDTGPARATLHFDRFCKENSYRPGISVFLGDHAIDLDGQDYAARAVRYGLYLRHNNSKITTQNLQEWFPEVKLSKQ
ncbi:hypothetical protein, partial [Gluconobacter kondonii]|uniref:hypothetical protein n=1 Tax=Gluconobacter kondonii TaxID=941463 RepID=UPI0022317263